LSPWNYLEYWYCNLTVALRHGFFNAIPDFSTLSKIFVHAESKRFGTLNWLPKKKVRTGQVRTNAAKGGIRGEELVRASLPLS
jgi:hypothetical protein